MKLGSGARSVGQTIGRTRKRTLDRDRVPEERSEQAELRVRLSIETDERFLRRLLRLELFRTDSRAARSQLVIVGNVLVVIEDLRSIDSREPEAVLDDRAVQLSNRIVRNTARLRNRQVLVSTSGAAVAAKERMAVTLELLRTPRHTEVAVPLIVSALGNDRDHTAGSAAVFGFETGRFDLNFLDEFKRNVVVRVERTSTEVGNFLTVDNPNVFRTRSTVNLETTRKTFRTNVRSGLQEAGKRGAFRKRIDQLLCEVGLEFRFRRVDGDVVAASDGNIADAAADLKLHICTSRTVECNRYVLLRSLEAFFFDRDRVGSHRNVRHDEIAIRIRHYGSVKASRGTGRNRGDFRTGNDGIVLVFHYSLDAAASTLCKR